MLVNMQYLMILRSVFLPCAILLGNINTFGAGMTATGQASRRVLAPVRDAQTLFNNGLLCEEEILREKKKGISIDTQEAMSLFQQSAALGYVPAMRKVAKCLLYGVYVEQDLQGGAQWYKQCADKGDADAMYIYGDCLHNGIGVSKDKEAAARYYARSADTGNPIGQWMYGDFLLEEGGIENKRHAANLYESSAASGNDKGMYKYARCLEDGVVYDPDCLAIEYYKRSAMLGNMDAKIRLKQLNVQLPKW
ncbi:MAG: sel1 repeat family protein [Holosporales bacterium]|jgi:TPR repeat protein|nr:sel1 repeat family protein [Holosporales bacterium]